MDYKIPEIIPEECGDCKYYTRTGKIDRFSGYCSFYDNEKYSNHKCDALTFAKEGKIPMESLQGKVSLDFMQPKESEAQPSFDSTKVGATQKIEEGESLLLSSMIFNKPMKHAIYSFILCLLGVLLTNISNYYFIGLIIIGCLTFFIDLFMWSLSSGDFMKRFTNKQGIIFSLTWSVIVNAIVIGTAALADNLQGMRSRFDWLRVEDEAPLIMVSGILCIAITFILILKRHKYSIRTEKVIYSIGTLIPFVYTILIFTMMVTQSYSPPKNAFESTVLSYLLMSIVYVSLPLKKPVN